MALDPKRARGAILRLALRRPIAVTVGLMLVVPAVIVAIGDYAFESSLTDGLVLVLGATGVALVAAGLGGRRPDWVE
jgi:hypothetical protein